MYHHRYEHQVVYPQKSYEKGIRSCELTSHIIDNPLKHLLDKTSCIKYDKSLSKGVSVQILESVRVEPNDDTDTRLKKCKIREGWWQKQLCTMEVTGGLNRRDSQKESTDQSKQVLISHQFSFVLHLFRRLIAQVHLPPPNLVHTLSHFSVH